MSVKLPKSEKTSAPDLRVLPKPAPAEDGKWLEALESVVAHALKSQGPEKTARFLDVLTARLRDQGIEAPRVVSTPYLNTIPVEKQAHFAGNWEMERRIKSYIRWNAMAMVVNANRAHSGLGGHISTYASAATLYEVAFNHFLRARTADFPGDMVYFQGHATPGIYARAFLEGRIDEQKLHHFRQELAEGGGLSSYPHPYLMPDFWQFPTVSMGLGPLLSIYQARFNRYLRARGFCKGAEPKVWAFIGDGETDEPETLGSLTLASRENLDNLIWVINCNLQRLDGPVRGNGKIIQELEASFQGAGWNVIKVIWGTRWDPLLARDTTGLLRKRMEECVDGEYQVFKSRDGAYVREHFFGKYPELKALVTNMSDDDIWAMTRGGHDPQKVYAAYKAATVHKGQPTVILAKTVKGYGMGESGEGQMISHQAKKMNEEALRQFRDRFAIPVSDEQLKDVPFVRFADDTPEMKYLREHRAALGGHLPARRSKSQPIEIPPLSAFSPQLKSTGDREISTTMAFVRILTTLLRDKAIGKRIVPIVPDESRTFGMEGMFRQFGIFSQVGQLYRPEDADELMFYREDKTGQILQEGINEPGAMASWIAAATSYSTSSTPMIPFYIYYSMFG